MSFELLLAFALIFTIDSYTPGPSVAAVAARSAAHGWRASVPLIIGLVVAELILFAAAIAGLAALAQAMGPAFALLKWAGVAYLLYMAWRMWTAPVDKNVRADPNLKGGMGAGLLVALGNPQAIGFYIAILPSLFDANTLPWSVILLVGLLIALIYTAALFTYAFTGDRAGRMASSAIARRRLNRASATGMAGAAVAVAVQT